MLIILKRRTDIDVYIFMYLNSMLTWQQSDKYFRRQRETFQERCILTFL